MDPFVYTFVSGRRGPNLDKTVVKGIVEESSMFLVLRSFQVDVMGAIGSRRL